MVAQSEPPQDASIRPTIHNRLPRYAQPLIGRERETEDLRTLLLAMGNGHPGTIVTLVGPGGVGKTRLAIRVAAILFDHLADGAIFVPLAAIDAPELLLPAIADALSQAGLPPTAGDAATRVHATLEARSVLVVLDNVEQIGGVGERLTELSTRLPNVLWLVTSRSPLHIAGETVFPLAPLPTPGADASPRTSPSVQLFTTHAQQANAAFQLTDANLPAVGEICRRLGGLPLALELAAARIRTLGPEEMTRILDRTSGALDLLEAGSAGRDERHASIRGALTWSSSLLAPSAQRLFRRLSVLPGSFSLAAAEQIGAQDDDAPILRDLESLVESSLIGHRIDDAGHSRYEMLQPVRELAREELTNAGETTDALRHLVAWGQAFNRDRWAAFQTSDHAEWLASMQRESSGIRAAIYAALDLGEIEAALRMISFSVWQYWGVRGLLRDEGSVINRALAAAEAASTPVAADVLAAGYSGQALRAHLMGDIETADRSYRRALELREELGEPGQLANTLNNYGLMLRAAQRNRDALPVLERSLAIRREIGRPRAVAIALMNLADLALAERDAVTARPLIEEAMAISEDTGDYLAVGYALMNLGEVELLNDDAASALSMAEQGLALVRHVGERRGVTQALDIAARAAAALRRNRAAVDYLAEAVDIDLQSGELRAVATNLEQIATLLNQPREAIFLLGAAAELRAQTESTPPESTRAAIAALRAAHPGPAFLIPWGDGRRVPSTQLGDEIARIAATMPADADPAAAPTPPEAERAGALPGATVDPLTERERDVLRLLVDGKSDREIAAALYISNRTASNHVSRILDKLGVRSRTAAVSVAIRLGVV